MSEIGIFGIKIILDKNSLEEEKDHKIKQVHVETMFARKYRKIGLSL